MALPVTDSFNYAIGTLGSSWTNEVNTASCSGTGYVHADVDTNTYIRWNADTFPNDQYAIIWKTGAASGPCTRMNSDTDCYLFYVFNVGGGSTLYRVDADTGTALASLGTTSDADPLKATLRSTGSVHVCYLMDKTLGVPISDATHSVGSGGMYFGGISTSIVDFEAGADPWAVVAFDGFGEAVNTPIESRNSYLPGGVTWSVDHAGEWLCSAPGYLMAIHTTESWAIHNSPLSSMQKAAVKFTDGQMQFATVRADISGNAFIGLRYVNDYYFQRADAGTRTDISGALSGLGAAFQDIVSTEVDSAGIFTMRKNGVSIYTYGPSSTHASNTKAGVWNAVGPNYNLIDTFTSYQGAVATTAAAKMRRSLMPLGTQVGKRHGI